MIQLLAVFVLRFILHNLVGLTLLATAAMVVAPRACGDPIVQHLPYAAQDWLGQAREWFEDNTDKARSAMSLAP